MRSEFAWYDQGRQLAGPKARTLRLLLDEAHALLQDGHIPSVAEVAARARVSRATAYRYFPSRSKLISAIVEHSLGPVRILASVKPDAQERIRDLFAHTFPRFKEYEPELRAALQLSLEHGAQERAGTLAEEPYRRGHRIKILSHAVEPLKKTLGKRRFDRLVRALSVIYGIEAYVVLRDIWGSSHKEIENIAGWIARSLVDSALREVRINGSGRQHRSNRS
ncbi:MAG TPA: TetR/AcrR family transcriptional regulator [Candidatus Cybelea sp.]|nr:TetR/AcrR family transcriptional regulator [Candidatus Cybelea sp.]